MQQSLQRRSNRCDYWWDDNVKFGLTVIPNMDGEQVVPPVEPVTVQDVKENSRIDIADDNLWIAKQIIAARELCETFLKRRFVTTTLRLTLDSFPQTFYLPSPPLVAVTSIKYYDLNGVQQTLSSSEYLVDNRTEPGRIVPSYLSSWPSTLYQPNAVEVIYTAGYGDPVNVPFSIKQAIVMTVSTWYENRENLNIGNLVNQLPDTAKALLRSQSWGFLP